MSVILTQPDVVFGATERVVPEDRGPALLRSDPTHGQVAFPAAGRSGFKVARVDDFGPEGRPSAGMVAVGTEEARSFGGEAAVFALLRESRREAATAMAEEAFRNHVPSPYDGTMRFGLAPKIGAALNDVETRDELFEACGRNWREFTQRPPHRVAEVRALWLQATHGDCDEPQPHDPRSRSLWFPWHKLLGLGHGEAKVRFIRKLYSIRPALVIPRLPGRPPPGFPRTAIGGKPICALCNSRRGCQEPLVVVPPGAPPNARPVALKAALDDMELLRSAEKTHALLDAALAEPRCEHGSHERVGPGIYKAFASYYALPGLGGFALYKDIDDKTGKTTAWEGVAKCYEQAVEREHVAHDWLHERVEHRKRSAPSAEKEAWRAARDEQAAVCVVLREAYAAWTGRAFKMRSECDKLHLQRRPDSKVIKSGGCHPKHKCFIPIVSGSNLSAPLSCAAFYFHRFPRAVQDNNPPPGAGLADRKVNVGWLAGSVADSHPFLQCRRCMCKSCDFRAGIMSKSS
jgi:acyl-CoA-binding protein